MFRFHEIGGGKGRGTHGSKIFYDKCDFGLMLPFANILQFINPLGGRTMRCQ